MDRRIFIRNTGLAAVLSGFAPSFAMKDIFPVQRKKIHFILRAVGYSDALHAFSKYNAPLKGTFSFKKVECNNAAYSHEKGLNDLMNGKNKEVLFTQQMDRHSIGDVVKDAFSSDQPEVYIHMHHTEVGHSSEPEFHTNLDAFFKEVTKGYDANKHTLIITADIGRNNYKNSCGGRDHSTTSSLETFALYIGKDLAEKSLNYGTLQQENVFSV